MVLLQYVEELMLLTLSDVERGIYDNCRTPMEKRQMCCHLQVVERLQKVIGNNTLMTLNQVKDVMIAHTNKVSAVTCICRLCSMSTLKQLLSLTDNDILVN